MEQQELLYFTKQCADPLPHSRHSSGPGVPQATCMGVDSPLPPELAAFVSDGSRGPADDLRFGLNIVRMALRALDVQHRTEDLLIDEEVLSWRLYSGQEYGGVYCADKRCDQNFCQSHNSEIYFEMDGDDDDPPTISLGELLLLVRHHIDGIRERSAE